MEYEISNTISNHKYDGWEISHKRPFKKGMQCFLVEDKPYALYEVFKRGHCLKPHAFKDAKDAFCNTIILDFDNLTKDQYDFVRSICRGKAYSFANIYGDDSSGMKTKRHEYEMSMQGIPNPPPFAPKEWKFKVFYGVDQVIVTYDEIYNAFFDAICFFNPLHSKDEVEKVFRLWVMADNQSLYYKHEGKDKDGVFHKVGDRKSNPRALTIEDERFKGFILPDVAMLKNFRNQITYGVDVNQVEKFHTLNENDYASSPIRKLIFTSQFPSTTKDDYRGVDWKVEFDTNSDANETNEPPKTIKKDEELNKYLALFKRAIEDAKKKVEEESFDSRLNFPCSKSEMAKRLGVRHLDDLVMENYPLVSMAMWSRINAKTRNGKVKIVDLDEIFNDLNLVKSQTRNANEYIHQCKKIGKRTMEKKTLALVKDIVQIYMTKYGVDCFDKLKSKHCKRGNSNATYLDKFLVRAARVMKECAHDFNSWRLKQKLLDANLPLEKSYMKYLALYRETKDFKYLKKYNEEKERILKEHRDEIESRGLEYLHIRKGLKKSLLDFASIPPKMDEDGFVNWAMNEIVHRLGVGEDEAKHFRPRIVKWYIDYRREVNKTWKEVGDGIPRKSRSSKWDSQFQNKSKDEIESIIKNEVKSKQERYYLRKKYLRERSI